MRKVIFVRSSDGHLLDRGGWEAHVKPVPEKRIPEEYRHGQGIFLLRPECLSEDSAFARKFTQGVEVSSMQAYEPSEGIAVFLRSRLKPGDAVVFLGEHPIATWTLVEIVKDDRIGGQKPASKPAAHV